MNMYRVFCIFPNGAIRIRFTKTRVAAQLIALKESKKRNLKFFAIDQIRDTQLLSSG
jgi:hypothetical protein